jgi:hypothetical protein
MAFGELPFSFHFGFLYFLTSEQFIWTLYLVVYRNAGWLCAGGVETGPIL